MRRGLSTQFQAPVRSRLGVRGGGTSGVSVKSRLGSRGGGVVGREIGRPAVTSAATTFTKSPITDARQKINLNRVISGRIGDARQNIEIKRSSRFLSDLPVGSGLAVSTMRSIGRKGQPRSGTTAVGFTSPIKTLKITTMNPPGRNSAGLFRNAVSGMGGSQWPYAPVSPPPQSNTNVTSSVMLTRTVKNPQPQSTFSKPIGLMSSGFSRMTTGGAGGLYSISTGRSSAMTKITSSTNRPRTQVKATIHNQYAQSDEEDEEDMELEEEPLPPPTVLRSSLKARLDVPAKFKIKVSNLQSTVTSDDIMELFADVGDLISARVLDAGFAEAYYRSKADCHKAIEAYHNRLLDGSPMKVVMVEEGQVTTEKRGPVRPNTGIIATLKSAGGATMKIPKSAPNPNVKIHPDISAIHKVLFQPSSSSNSTKMLFNKTN